MEISFALVFWQDLFYNKFAVVYGTFHVSDHVKGDKMNSVFGKIPVLLAVLVFVFMPTGCSAKQTVELNELQTDVTEAGEEEKESVPAELAVHICGAVQNPGVYMLAGGSRICDAIRAAGGLSEDASDHSVNQAALLADGMQIVIPTLEEVSAAMADSGEAQGGQKLIDLNTATLTELMTLPGIGETRANAILAYREKCGRFSSVEEIMQVSGIKEGSFEKLREYITVR